MKDEYNRFADEYEALNELADAIVAKMFIAKGLDPGKFVLLVHRKTGAFGYTTTRQIWPDANGVPHREVGISPVAFISLDEVMTTMAHEFVHCYDMDNNVKDCSNKCHNEHFKDVCDIIGLPCSLDENNPEFGFTTPSGHIPVFDEILASLSEKSQNTLKHLKSPYELRKKKEKKPKMRWVCPACGQTFAGKPEMSVICGVCNVPFEYREID